MHFLTGYLKQRRNMIFMFFLFCLVFVCALLMYRLPLEAALYPVVVCVFLGLVFLGFDMRKVWYRYRRLQELQGLPGELQSDFPKTESLEDYGYQQIIRQLCEGLKQLEEQMNTRYSDMIDYYTIWAHQIKTPIASMRLNLQNQDSEFSRRTLEDLFRIEQYVEMVLCYLRLDSDSTDYVIREYDLDDIVKQTVKKFSVQFIRKKIKLCYQPLHTKVVTDEKWLQFVVEQLLSNAIKYSAPGSTIEMYANGYDLVIEDHGCGISASDLKRIREKGFTGENGRVHKEESSGLGLYLCEQVLGRLHHPFRIESTLNEGTRVVLRLDPALLERE